MGNFVKMYHTLYFFGVKQFNVYICTYMETSYFMVIEILNKEQFLEAVKEDPSLLIVTDTRINNEGQEIIFFSRCSEPFTMDEYNELCKEHIHDLEALALRAEQMVEIHSPIPPLKGESVFSPKKV